MVAVGILSSATMVVHLLVAEDAEERRFRRYIPALVSKIGNDLAWRRTGVFLAVTDIDDLLTDFIRYPVWRVGMVG